MTSTSSLAKSSTSTALKSVISPRPRSRSIELHSLRSGQSEDRDILEWVVRLEFLAFWVLAVAVILLHFKLNHAEIGDVERRLDL